MFIRNKQKSVIARFVFDNKCWDISLQMERRLDSIGM